MGCEIFESCERPQIMMTLQEYFQADYPRVIDHTLRVTVSPDGTFSFYIHPSSVSGNTLDFVVKGNELIPGQWAVTHLNPASGYFLDTDAEAHWYIVEVAKRLEWEDWKSLDASDSRSWTAPAFAKELGGHPRNIEFKEFGESN